MSFLPAEDRDYLASKSIVFDEIDENGQKAVVLKCRQLPVGRFDSASADVLILLPKGYPDVAPDMFYLMPWVKLVSANAFPRQADQPFEFSGTRWQRWSRHNSDWRAGVDGIWTMLKRVEEAIEKAAA